MAVEMELYFDCRRHDGEAVLEEGVKIRCPRMDWERALEGDVLGMMVRGKLRVNGYTARTMVRAILLLSDLHNQLLMLVSATLL